MPPGESNVDLMGFQRGAHRDGPHVCSQFTITPMKAGVWNWNATEALFCTCGRPATEHVVVKDLCEAAKARAKPPAKQRMHQPAGDPMQWRPQPPASVVDDTGLQLLDEANDPLAFHSGIRLVPATTPPSAPAAPQLKPQPVGAEAAQPDDYAEYLEWKKAREQAKQREDENEAFKREVEAMVRAKVAADSRSAAPNGDGAGDGGGGRGGQQPARAWAGVAELLREAELPQYTEAFERECVEPSQLAELLRLQGKEALDAVLKEAGVRSIGHRIKIGNVLSDSR